MVYLWNAGNATVDRSAIVASDPLRFLLSAEAEALRTSLVRQTRPVIGVSATAKANAIEVGFDFLDQSDGFMVEIIHTGDEKIRAAGTIRGMRAGVKEVGEVNFKTATEDAALIYGVLFLLLVAGIILALFRSWENLKIVGAMSIFFILMAVINYSFNRARSAPKVLFKK